MLCDYHVHSEYSDDSEYLMEDVITDAISLGIKELAFTDHVDYGIKKDFYEDHLEYLEFEGQRIPLVNVVYPKYIQQIEELQKKYPQITIRKGLEFGIQTHTIEKYNVLFNTYEFDFIILSIHQVENQEFWNKVFQQGRTQQQYNEKYYQELLNVVKLYKNYSVLGHLDLIVRYDEAGAYPFEKVKPMITEILKQVIADNKGIEVNTSYHRYGLKDMTPSRDILKLYRELGGKIITIGSDSHKKEHLGAYIEEAKDELRKLGYEYYCTFDKMQPIYHKL